MSIVSPSLAPSIALRNVPSLPSSAQLVTGMTLPGTDRGMSVPEGVNGRKIAANGAGNGAVRGCGDGFGLRDPEIASAGWAPAAPAASAAQRKGSGSYASRSRGGRESPWKAPKGLSQAGGRVVRAALRYGKPAGEPVMVFDGTRG